MTELHKQRYKAVLTNSGLSVANDKLQEKVEAERQRAAAAEEKSAALEAKFADDVKSLEGKLAGEFGKTGFSEEASAKVAELDTQIGVLEAEVASLKETEVRVRVNEGQGGGVGEGEKKVTCKSVRVSSSKISSKGHNALPLATPPGIPQD